MEKYTVRRSTEDISKNPTEILEMKNQIYEIFRSSMNGISSQLVTTEEKISKL